jgi:hypothetical protein
MSIIAQFIDLDQHIDNGERMASHFNLWQEKARFKVMQPLRYAFDLFNNNKTYIKASRLRFEHNCQAEF